MEDISDVRLSVACFEADLNLSGFFKLLELILRYNVLFNVEEDLVLFSSKVDFY